MNLQLGLSITAGIVAMLTSLGALWLSIRLYLRQKSQENENHFFKYKMEQYHIIIQSGFNLLNIYDTALLEMQHELNRNITDSKVFENIADEVDQKTDDFREVLNKNCAFIPEVIVEKLDYFYNRLYDETEAFEQTDLSQLSYQIKSLVNFESEFEDIINLMRIDLGIESLDRRLKSRTHK